MHALARDLDHVGTLVADLDAGRVAFERLGFALAPRSQHRAALAPGQPPQLLGQGNHCAMLEQGYLEVLGVVDRSLPVPVQRYLDRYAGPHIFAFRPSSQEAASALAASGAPLDPPKDLGREVPYGPQGLQTRRVDFRTFRFHAASFPEGTFFFTQHLSRDAMWQPHLLVHPNGAKRLARGYLFATDPAETAHRMGRLLGVQARDDGQGGSCFAFEASELHVLSVDGMRHRFPGIPVPPTSRPVGFAIAVSSIDAAAALLEGHGIAFQRAESGGLAVAPGDACGNILHFIPAAS